MKSWNADEMPNHKARSLVSTEGASTPSRLTRATICCTLATRIVLQIARTMEGPKSQVKVGAQEAKPEAIV